MARKKSSTLRTPRPRYVPLDRVRSNVVMEGDEVDGENVIEDFEDKDLDENRIDENNGPQRTVHKTPVSAANDCGPTRCVDGDGFSVPAVPVRRHSILKPQKGYVNNAKYKQTKLEVKETVTPFGRQLKEKLTIRFVSHTEKGRKSDLLKEAHRLLTKNMDFLSTQWITDVELLRKLEGDSRHVLSGVFVTDLFDGQLFDRLIAQPGCRIFGPLAIFTLTQSPLEHLPVRDHPIFTLALRKMVFSFSGVAESKDQLIERLQRMSGTAHRDFRSSVNYLISESLTSVKCRLARKRGIKILHPNFVRECWNLTLANELLNDVEKLISKHQLKVFSDFVLSSTGV